MISTSDIHKALNAQKQASNNPADIPQELRNFAATLGAIDASDEVLLRLKEEVVNTRDVGKTQLTEKKVEFKAKKEVFLNETAELRAEIDSLKALITNCNDKLGIKVVKKASKAQILDAQVAALKDELIAAQNDKRVLQSAIQTLTAKQEREQLLRIAQ